MNLRDKTGKALDIFIDNFRIYVIDTLESKVGKKWPDVFKSILRDEHQQYWDNDIIAGKESKNLIDWKHLKSFSIGCKEFIRNDFGRKTNSLPTWLEEIVDVRNSFAHNDSLDEYDVDRAISNMIRIFQLAKITNAEKNIRSLREISITDSSKITDNPTNSLQIETSGMLPWFRNVRPHEDIREGRLDECVFAADLAEVANGSGREIYSNSELFFEKTFFTAGLKNIAKRVIRGLNGGVDAENRVISLQTGFGGGKTHCLISLYHIAKSGKKLQDSVFVDELIEITGEPEFDTANIAVFTNTTNDPVQGRTVDGINIKTLWGEIAYQLGGKEVYDIIRQNDEQRTAPKGLFKKILKQTKPALILIDELADYCVAASAVQVGNSSLADQTISFIQEISEAVAGTDNCVFVATLPASVDEIAASENGQEILTSLSNRLMRVGADTKPVAADEIFEVIRCRLFEDLGDELEIEKVISQYSEMYKNLARSKVLPTAAEKPEYKDKLRKAYPFHPELIDMFRKRWASNHDFQRTRGVLRLLASIVADLWNRQNSLGGSHGLIHTSDVNFANLDALTGQLKKLWGNGYEAVITADVSGASSNAFRIDNDNPDFGRFSIAQGIASTILLGTFGGNVAAQGMGISEIKLCVQKPGSFNHNSVNSIIDIFEDSAHYLYYTQVGTSRKYWFNTEPNINILINQLKNDIKEKEFNNEILNILNESTKFSSIFDFLIDPSSDIPEQKKPTFILLNPEFAVTQTEINSKTENFVKRIASKKGNADRIYKNTILFIAPNEKGIAKLISNVKEYISCNKIKEEYRFQLKSEQLQDIKNRIDDVNNKIKRSLCSAYNVILKYTNKEGIKRLDIKNFNNSFNDQLNNTFIELLKTEEWLLESIGLNLLRKNNLLPTKETPVKVKDIYEAFIRFDDKPMITGINAIQVSLLRYCQNGEFAIATGDSPDNFTKTYYKEQPRLFDVLDETYWLIDKSLHVSETETPDENGGTESSSGEPSGIPKPDGDKEIVEKEFDSVIISGKVDVSNYHQVFTSFVQPLIKNNVEIEIRVKGKSTETNPITESSEQYKTTKESAKQLGLNFTAE